MADIDNADFAGDLDKSLLEKMGIKFMAKFSVVPNFDKDSMTINFVDKVMKNSVSIKALPAVELIVALPESYPSH